MTKEQIKKLINTLETQGAIFDLMVKYASKKDKQYFKGQSDGFQTCLAMIKNELIK